MQPTTRATSSAATSACCARGWRTRKFFYDQDRKTRLEARVPQLASVVYHNKLGSQLERVERIQLLAGKIARELGADAAAGRARRLAVPRPIC